MKPVLFLGSRSAASAVYTDNRPLLDLVRACLKNGIPFVVRPVEDWGAGDDETIYSVAVIPRMVTWETGNAYKVWVNGTKAIPVVVAHTNVAYGVEDYEGKGYLTGAESQATYAAYTAYADADGNTTWATPAHSSAVDYVLKASAGTVTVEPILYRTVSEVVRALVWRRRASDTSRWVYFCSGRSYGAFMLPWATVLRALKESGADVAIPILFVLDHLDATTCGVTDAGINGLEGLTAFLKARDAICIAAMSCSSPTGKAGTNTDLVKAHILANTDVYKFCEHGHGTNEDYFTKARNTYPTVGDPVRDLKDDVNLRVAAYKAKVDAGIAAGFPITYSGAEGVVSPPGWKPSLTGLYAMAKAGIRLVIVTTGSGVGANRTRIQYHDPADGNAYWMVTEGVVYTLAGTESTKTIVDFRTVYGASSDDHYGFMLQSDPSLGILSAMRCRSDEGHGKSIFVAHAANVWDEAGVGDNPLLDILQRWQYVMNYTLGAVRWARRADIQHFTGGLPKAGIAIVAT